MHAMVNIALRAARSAAEALLQSGDRLDRVRIINNDPRHFVSSADKDSESTIIYHLQKAYPNHSFKTRLGENIEGAEGEPTWLIDPLVGSFNFSRGIDRYGVSIACQIEGTVTHAVVMVPTLNEEFTATRGNGAQLNNRKIRASEINDDALPIFALDSGNKNTPLLSAMANSINAGGAAIRISGCSSLDMVFTAVGRYTGGWCTNHDNVSQHAVNLLLTEAGALLGSKDGSPDISNATELIFGGPKAFKALVKLRQSIEQ